MTENNRILIVDDDRGIRHSYKYFLGPNPTEGLTAKSVSPRDEPAEAAELVSRDEKEYDLTLAETGEEAVKAVQKAVDHNHHFAAAFIDMRMPGIDGAETSKRIWAMDPRIKLVIVTAFSEFKPDDIIRVTGRDDLFYLRKPFHPGEIKQFARALTNQWNLESERELLSSKLEDINKNLKEKVDQQTALLVQSEKMASIGTLAAGVAHEMNNPISFINGNLSSIKKYCVRIRDLLEKYEQLEALVDRSHWSKGQDSLEEIRDFKERQKIDFILQDLVNLAEESLDGTERVGKIVKDLKTFSRVHQEELKYVDIKEVMDATLNIIHNELKYKVEIVINFDELPKVKCFPHKVSQVFMNILVNAAQAIEAKGTITIAGSYKQKGNRADDKCVELSISDTGCGIPKRDLFKVFDPFFTTKPVGQGTGLGLSITYDIVKAHGGKIVVESEERAGTTFTITLPLEAKI
ncbi:MAG: ATP-binding protein [Thermodesulfobacteriota bacterium]|nr:ATP-binding protein [Thermodesulfobacteriota bacterium]